MEPDINPDIRKRIIAAADQLYAQAGDGSIPNVDAVRRTAKVNMNDVSAVMKQWRRAHLAKAAPIPLLIPDPVQQSCQAGLEHLWRTAQECANQHLRTAQAGWEQERAENDTLCLQLSKAFDELALASADQQGLLQAAGEELQAISERREAAERELAASNAGKADATARAERAEARAGSQEQRAADLKDQLALAHTALARAQDDLEKAHLRGDATAEALRAELCAAVASAADAERGLAISQAQSSSLQETASASRAQCSAWELRSAQAEALAVEAQRQASALSEQLARARGDLDQAGKTLHAAQTAAAASQGERDAMAANLAQLLAVFNTRRPQSGRLRRRHATPGQPDGEATK